MVLSNRGRARGVVGGGLDWTLRDEAPVSFSEAETEDPNVLCEPLGPTAPDHVNTREEDVIPNTSKRTRGVAKGTEFEKLRRYGKIPLEIKDGTIGPCCNNRTVYTTRVTWIVKHYAEMRHPSWSVIDANQKDELVDRVRADFVLDWAKISHRRTVTSQLSRAYNAFHYMLDVKYLKYATHEEALGNGGDLVEKPVWEWLCNRWGSNEFKKMSSQNKQNRRKQNVNHTSGRTSFAVLLERKKEGNLIDFYKDAHWSSKKGRFVTPTTEENYHHMVEMMNEKEPDARTNEAAAEIFRTVLGHRSGYARGLGHSVMPESSKVDGVSNEEYERLAMENAENRKSAEYYQDRLKEIEGGFMAMREHMQEYERANDIRMSKLESRRETHPETVP